MQDKRKKLFLITGVIAAVLLCLALSTSIKILPFKAVPPAQNAALQKRAAAAVAKKGHAAPFTTGAVNPQHQEMAAEDSTAEEQSQEENPEKKEKIDALEKQIKVLHQAKEKGQHELDTLLAAIDDAQVKPKLTADGEPKKDSEIKVFKMFLLEMMNKNLESIDSSLKEKLQEYNSAISDEG